MPLQTDAAGSDDSSLLPQMTRERVRSVSRALHIFEFFHARQRPAKAIEVSDGLCIPRSSAHELLHALVDTGFLTFDHEKRTYFPSLRIVRLGQGLTTFYFGDTRIFDLLQEISDETGESCGASVRNDIHMQLVATVLGRNQTMGSSEGAVAPILDSAAGCALQMTFSNDQIVALIRKVTRRRRLTKNDPGCKSYIRLIDRFRVQGYSLVKARQGRLSVAAPIPGGVGNAPLVIGLGGHEKRIAPKADAYGRLLCEKIRALTNS